MDWSLIGSKRDKEEIIRSITGIPLAVPRGDSLVRFGVLERVAWMQGAKLCAQRTRRIVFSVSLMLHYPSFMGSRSKE